MEKKPVPQKKVTESDLKKILRHAADILQSEGLISIDEGIRRKEVIDDEE